MLERFSGHILGVGTTSGTRIVLGNWARTPFGAFADVMVARPDGRRILLAPDARIAEYVSSTYQFDEVEVVDVQVVRERGFGPAGDGDLVGDVWVVRAGPLAMRVRIGGPTPLGRLLSLVPARLATSAGFTRLTDPVARVALRGVRTRGSAGHGRREFYGARGMHAVTALTATWDGVDLGALAPVSPAPDFGFGSTPERPAVVAVTTTILGAETGAAHG
ncbi:hypothetical protein [Agilicoccus flavus]|uniref:hypothetical protein n=1 Tax=Agilicoccus flavus TaxID=2775968 RepID=UPI001CF64001|nr:hypothetical protein [Agilicoccus flavus]